MTLLVGAACESGAVLLTDSLAIIYRGQQAYFHLMPPRSRAKIGVLPHAHVGYCVAGAVQGGALFYGLGPLFFPPPEDFEADSFEAAARLLYADFRARRPDLPDDDELRTLDGEPLPLEDKERWQGQVLLVANLRQEGPRLGRLDGQSEQWFDAGIVVSGAAEQWWKSTGRSNFPPHLPRHLGRVPERPTSLQECANAADAIARAYERHCYPDRPAVELLRDLARGQAVELPTVAPPYRTLYCSSAEQVSLLA